MAVRPTPVVWTGNVVERTPRRRISSSCRGVRVESIHRLKSSTASAAFSACCWDHSRGARRSSACGARGEASLSSPPPEASECRARVCASSARFSSLSNAL